MKRWYRRFRANLHYLRRPLLRFVPLLLLLVGVLTAGTFSFHAFGVDEVGRPLSYQRSVYITYCLIFMEHLLPLPSHPLLQAFYYVLPPLGLVVVLDGFIRFGYNVLRRDETGPEWVRAMTKTYAEHVVLCGLGRVGLRILQQLQKLGEDVVALEKNPDNPNLTYARKSGIPVLIGGGREEGILNDLNVSQAKSIILATDDDLANLEMALDARKINPKIHVVLRMYDQELASKIREAFGIELAFSTAAQAAPLFATSSSDRTIANSFYVGEELVVVANVVVQPGSDLVGQSLGSLTAERTLLFLRHARGEQAELFPDAGVTLAAGDEFTVQTSPQTLKRLHKKNRGAASV